MKIDELIQQRSEELHTAYTRRSPLPVPGVRDRSPWLVVAGVAAAVLLLVAPVAWFGRTGADVQSSPAVTPPAVGPTVTATQESLTGAATEEPLTRLERVYEGGGDWGQWSVVDTDEGLLGLAHGAVLRSTDNGQTWMESMMVSGNQDSLSRATYGDGILVTVGAHDGATSRLYRSEDLGANWTEVSLPMPDGVVRVVPQEVVYLSSGFTVAGIGTTSTFDDDVSMYVWRSSNGLNWGVELAANFGQELTHAMGIDEVDGTTVIWGWAPGISVRVLEQLDGESVWHVTELSPMLEAQAGITPDLRNTGLLASEVIGDELTAWWYFNNGGADDVMIEAKALTRRTATGDWEAAAVVGANLRTVTVTADGFIGTAHPAGTFPSTKPGFTTIVVSVDGVTWDDAGSFDNLTLHNLTQIDNTRFLAAGETTSTTEDGYVSRGSSGIWQIDLAQSLSETVRLAADRGD